MSFSDCSCWLAGPTVFLCYVAEGDWLVVIDATEWNELFGFPFDEVASHVF